MSRILIRRCDEADFDTIWTIVNDGAQAYNGYVPADCLRSPYMSRDELREEIFDDVQFWGYQEGNMLVAVMGLQQVHDVTLIRHAYVRTGRQNQGFGGELLRHLLATLPGPVLIGTWADAVWAISFYKRYGFRMVEAKQKSPLLRRYWNVPERQIDVSVVLGNERWHSRE